jgi:uncharacterized protein YciI
VKAGRLAIEIHPWQAGEGIGAGYDLKKPKGGVPDEMQEHFLAFFRRKPGAPADPAIVGQIEDEQQAYADRLHARGKLSLSGPITDDGAIRGAMVFRPDLLPEEARELAQAAPAVRRGLWDAEAHTWWVVKGVLP